MRTAIIGIRGIPANYGGFETFAEQLAPRLAARGHDVTVYCRKNAVDYEGDEFRGVRLITLPTIHTKHLDTPVHTALSCFRALRERYDVVLVCNAANTAFTAPLRLAGVPVIVNVDGIERLRKKWGRAGRGWYWLSEFLATKMPSAIVSDATVIHDYYRQKWNADSTMIPYGANTDRPETSAALSTYGLNPGGYLLCVARLEPENNIDLVLRAFARVKTDLRLVIVGDTPFDNEYKDRLRASAAKDPRVLMTGFLYGAPCKELQAHSYAYIHAADVGGTSPALLESMAMGSAPIASATAQNLEVIGAAGWSFDVGSEDALAQRIQYATDHPETVATVGDMARTRILDVYSWEAVTDSYERLLDTHRRHK